MKVGIHGACLVGAALALIGCARSESADDSQDMFGASIARQDRAQANATVQRQEAGRAEAARNQENARAIDTRRQAN